MRFKGLNGLFFVVLFIFDFVAVYSAYLTAFYLYEHFVWVSPQSLSEVLRFATIPAGLTVVSFSMCSVYRCPPGPLGLDQLRRVLLAYFWGGMVCLSLTFFTKSQEFSRLMVTMGMTLGIGYVLIGRAVFIRLQRLLRTNLKLDQRILVLGAGKVGTALARNLLNIPGGVRIMGFLDDQYPELTEVTIKHGENVRAVPVLGKLSDLQKVSSEVRPSEVIVAMTRAGLALNQGIFEKVRELGLSFSIVPSALDLMLAKVESYSIGRIPLFRVEDKPEFILAPVLKRTVDLVGAIVVTVLSLPFWPLIALAIKIDSKGPVFFIHERSGKNGERFNLFKFRTMSIATNPYATKSRTDNASSVTTVGRILRKTSLDELPQVINVLLGHMSLVGPRPEMPFIVDTYNETQKLRLSVKPGVTGVWQISADRANPIHENIDYDLYYLENQSFWLDCAIMIKTCTSVVKGIGAY